MELQNCKLFLASWEFLAANEMSMLVVDSVFFFCDFSNPICFHTIFLLDACFNALDISLSMVC